MILIEIERQNVSNYYLDDVQSLCLLELWYHSILVEVAGRCCSSVFVMKFCEEKSAAGFIRSDFLSGAIVQAIDPLQKNRGSASHGKGRAKLSSSTF